MNKYRDFLLKFNPKEKIEKFKDVYLVELDIFGLKSFGKGLDLNKAKLSAYGEMSERLILKNYFEEFYIDNLYNYHNTSTFLNKELHEFYKISELEKEELLDFNTDSFDILSIKFKHNTENILFPVNIIHNIYASNGMAAHFNIDDAIYSARMEIIERYVKFEVLQNKIELKKIAHYLNDTNLQVYIVENYPVVAISYIKKDNIIISFAADLEFKKAVEKAYTELLQTKLIKFGKIVDEKIDELELEKHFINLSGNVNRETLNTDFSKFEWKNFNIDFDEYIRIEKKDNIFAVQIIIPGISEIYRIDDLIYNNINRGKFIRQKIFNRDLSVLDDIYPYEEIGNLIGIELKEKLYLEDLFKSKQLEYSKRYLDILNLNRRINEI